MGCSTCKQNNESSTSAEGDTPSISLLPESFMSGGFSDNLLFKIIAFGVVLIAIPFIILVLVGQMFLTFFLPKSLPKATKKLKSGVMYVFQKYADFKTKKILKKREQQFNKNRGYEEGSDLIDIEDLSDINVHENNKGK